MTRSFGSAQGRDEAVAAGIEAGSMLYDKVRRDRTQLEFLYDLAVAAPDGIAVECGCYHGGSTVTLGLARLGRGPVIAVDNRATENYAPGLAARWASYGLDNVTLLEVATWDAPHFIGGPAAFCFIDADHSYRGIPRDVVAWPDRIMPGGILAFHDYGVWKPAVVVGCIVDAWQAEAQWERVGLVGALVAFRRPA